MKSDIPKQYLEIVSVPIIIRTIRCFTTFDSSIHIIVCVHPSYLEYVEALLKKFELSNFTIQITSGGETRFESVKNGLKLIENEQSIVGIHDAARPFVSKETLELCYTTAELSGNAVPCLPVHESLRKISNNVNNSVNRNEYKIIQTPQCFFTPSIKKAFEQEYRSNFTDDATVLEGIGEIIHLVEGNSENIKITSPLDLKIAEVLAIGR